MPRTSEKPEMSFAHKTMEYTPVEKARDELRMYNEAISHGEAFMSKSREPFCRPCMWAEFKKRQAIHAFHLQNKMPTKPVEVPAWKDYAGKDKFDFKDTVERRNRREGTIDRETNYACKNNPKHGVTIAESVPWHPELPSA